MPALIFQHQKR